MTITLTDAEKLRALAAWFDAYDRGEVLPIFRADPSDEVQRDLRRIADRLDAIDGVQS